MIPDTIEYKKPARKSVLKELRSEDSMNLNSEDVAIERSSVYIN
jgi:hypothetical protein